MKNKYNKLRTATLIYLVIICVSWQYLLSKCIPGYRLEQDVRESLSSENPWAICMIQGLRGLPYAVDVSNSKVYIAYYENDCIDVYSITGEYEYTFLFQLKKGCIDIRCVDGRLYVRDCDNIFYVFDNDKEIERMDANLASANGYNMSLFNEEEVYQIIDGKIIQHYDKNGELTGEITIKPSENNACFQREFACFVAVLTCAHIVYLLYSIIVARKVECQH